MPSVSLPPEERLARWFERAPVALFIAVALWYCAEYYVLGPWSYLKVHDNADSHMGRYIWLSHALLEHGLVYNFPQFAGGVDRLANGTRVFDLVTALHLALPDWGASAMMFIVQVAIAGIFAWRLGRDRLGLAAPGAAVAGLLWAVSQAQQLDFALGFAALPLVIWLIGRAQRLAGWRWLAAHAGIGLGYGLSAPPTILGLTIPLAFAWFVVVERALGWRLVAGFLLLGVAAGTGQAQLIAALVLNAPDSHRADRVHAGDLGQAVANVLHGLALSLPGLVPYALAIIGRRGGLARPAPIHALLALLLLTVLFVAFSRPLQAQLPAAAGPLRGFNFDHMVYAVPFLAAMLAGAATECFSGRHLRLRRREIALAPLALVLVTTYAAADSLVAKARNAPRWIIDGSYQANFGGAQWRAFGERLAAEAEPVRTATVGISGLHNAVTLNGGEALGGYLNMYPARMQQFWLRLLDPAFQSGAVARAPVAEWGNKLYLSVGADVDQAGYRLAEYFRTNLLALANVRYVISFLPIEDSGLELVSTPTRRGDWATMSTWDKALHNLRANFLGRESYIYRNPAALPRWFLVGDVRRVEDAGAALDAAAVSPPETLRRTAWVEDDVDLPAGATGIESPGTVAMLEYAPDRIVLEVDATAGALLVVSNSWNRFWRARIDGEEARIVPTNGVFWGVAVPAGRHNVTFDYRPPYRID